MTEDLKLDGLPKLEEKQRGAFQWIAQGVSVSDSTGRSALRDIKSAEK
jgi:hypothetical protein